MNYKQRAWKKQRLIQSIDFKDRKEGSVKIYKNNTYLHELIKFQVCWKLKQLGFDVYTECCINECRVDVAAISPNSNGFICEILNSESESRYDEKLNKYNIEWEMIKINCKDFCLDTFEL